MQFSGKTVMQVNPKIIRAGSADWDDMAAEAIAKSIESCISLNGSCTVMLTGGNTAERLYKTWKRSSRIRFESVRFLFGDERCVAPDDQDSNYAMVMRTLFNGTPPSRTRIERMEAERGDLEAASRHYESLLPDQVDILLLGMGEDGHIASIFPDSPLFSLIGRSVSPVKGPKFPYDRLTITPETVKNAKEIFLLATGAEKGRVLSAVLSNPDNYLKLPVCLTIQGTWLLDTDASENLIINN